jgi:hypothetical protein
MKHALIAMRLYSKGARERDDSGESFLAGQIFKVTYGWGQIYTGEYVINNYRTITYSYLVDLDLYRYLLKNRGVASRNYLYALPPRL